MTPTWSAPVRYAEIDGQHIVFNAHYLTYCDEAITAFLRQRGLDTFSADIRLVSSQLTWTGSARWGDVVDVDVRCAEIGRTSFVMNFHIAVRGTSIVRVTTTYVRTDEDGTPQPVSDEIRAALLQTDHVNGLGG